MRVALLIDRWWPRRGGAEACLLTLVERLLESGAEAFVVAAAGPRAHEPDPCEVRLVRALGLTRAGRERRLACALEAGARAGGADVTLGIRHLPRVDVLWLHGGSHAASCAALARTPLDPGRLTGRHRLFHELEARAVAGGAARILAPSLSVLDELRAVHGEQLDEARCEVVSPGVDLDRFGLHQRLRARITLRGRLGIAAGVPLISLPARNPALKGAHELFAALARLHDFGWQLCLAGPKRPASWLQAAARAGLDPARVHVLADVDPVELAAGADLCCLPTWRDTVGLVVLEALASGTPVITSRFAGCATGLPGDLRAQVVDDPADAAALAGAIERSLSAAPPAPAAVRQLVLAEDQRRALGRVVAILEEVALDKLRARGDHSRSPDSPAPRP